MIGASPKAMAKLSAYKSMKGAKNIDTVANFEKEEYCQIGNAFFTKQLDFLAPKNRSILLGMYETSPNVAVLFQKLGLEVLESEIKTEPIIKQGTPKERAEAMAMKILGSKNCCLDKEQFLLQMQAETKCNRDKALIGLDYMLKEGVAKITQLVENANPFLGIGSYKEVVYIENLF